VKWETTPDNNEHRKVGQILVQRARDKEDRHGLFLEEFCMVRTLLYQWFKANWVFLANAGSLVGTYAVTSVLGFAYWWVAARQFPPEAVGLASAAISAMMLLGIFCIFGLGTLLIGELPRHPGQEGSLISAALILVGGVGGCSGIVFAVVTPYFSTQLQPLRANIEDVVLFAIGVSLTAITLVLDQALIGLLRGDLQLWRNTLLAGTKLVALFLAGLWLSQKVGLTIYATWTVGNALSLLVLGAFTLVNRRWSGKAYRPHWGLLRKLRTAALQHHLLNLIFQAPTMALPLLVTVLLSATMNAWFYSAFLLANMAFLATSALTTVLYTTNPAQTDALTHRTRLTLGLSIVTTVLANCVLLFGTKQLLGVYGHTYAEQAAWSLRILGLAAFPQVLKSHFVTICRIKSRIGLVLLPMIAGACLELGGAILGAYVGGLAGLSLGWLAAVSFESMFMFRTVYRVIWPIHSSVNIHPLPQYMLRHNSMQAADINVDEPISRQ
jgi:O-antigen/teichoic acid export membrane protein